MAARTFAHNDVSRVVVDDGTYANLGTLSFGHGNLPGCSKYNRSRKSRGDARCMDYGVYESFTNWPRLFALSPKMANAAHTGRRLALVGNL